MTTQLENNVSTIRQALTAPLSYAIVAQSMGKTDRKVEATFTLENPARGSHVTFKVSRPKGYRTLLLSVMTGSDNENSFEYVGSMNRGLYIKAKQGTSAKAQEKMIAVSWYMDQLKKADRKQRSHYTLVNLHHSGKCTCCGRKLTHPESLATGIGPICGGRL